MKILMLGWELPPDNSGGLGVASYQMCKALSNKGTDLEFILPYTPSAEVNFMQLTATSNSSPLTSSWRPLAYSSYRFGSPSQPDLDNLFRQEYDYQAAVSQLTRSKSFDIIHANDWLTFRAALKVKETTGKPLVVHVHSVEADRSGQTYGGNPLVREIEALGLTMADKIVAVSQLTKQSIINEYHIPANKIEVIYNGLDSSELGSLDKDNAYSYIEAMKAHGYKVVTSVSRLTIQKGLYNLLHAAKGVVEHLPKTLFLIVGSGEQEFELIELSAKLGLQRQVIFTGFQRGKNWRDAFSIADLFVLTSISEPFGLTPLEATYYGTPSLITRQSGIAEVFKNCLKVDSWDVSEMANQIVGCLSNPSLHDQLRDNAYRELAHLDWDESSNKLLAIYDDQLKENT